MRMPRFRFSIRRMMIAVAILGIVFGTESLRRRRGEYLKSAETWDRLRRDWEDMALIKEDSARSLRDSAKDSRNLAAAFPESDRAATAAGLTSASQQSQNDEKFAEDKLRDAQDYRSHASTAKSLAMKYARAARYPWLPVAPDPPYPE